MSNILVTKLNKILVKKMSNQTKNPNLDKVSILQNANKQLLQNQTFLYSENQKLQELVNHLQNQLEQLRQSTINPDVVIALRKEKESLLTLTHSLKQKIKLLKTSGTNINEYEKLEQRKQGEELIKSTQELDKLLTKMNLHSDRLVIKQPQKQVTETFTVLTRKLEEEQRRAEEANESLRKLREDDEKYVLREKITDMKQLLTDLEVENTKLKFESEQLADDVQSYKKALHEAMEEAKSANKKCCEFENEKDKFKQIINDLENDNIRLKKEMIEELNEANRAKRVSVDTEIALQHISEAYENKRKEAMALSIQLDDAEKIIRGFREQFEVKY